MSTIDEILAAGWYTDKRGRELRRSEFLPGWVTPSGFNYFGEVYAFVYEDEMRLLVERDMHRDECPGLQNCEDHPVPHVYREGPRSRWRAHPGGFGPFAKPFYTLPAAVDAARALAVNP